MTSIRRLPWYKYEKYFCCWGHTRNIGGLFLSKCKHNRLNIVEKEIKKKSVLIKVSCTADINISFKILKKKNIYGQLFQHIHILYLDYGITLIPIIIDLLSCNLRNYTLQIQSIIATVKIYVFSKIQHVTIIAVI